MLELAVAKAIQEMQAVIDHLKTEKVLVKRFGDKLNPAQRVSSRYVLLVDHERGEAYEGGSCLETLCYRLLVCAWTSGECGLHLRIFSVSQRHRWRKSSFIPQPSARQLVEYGFTAQDIRQAWIDFLKREAGVRVAQVAQLNQGIGAARQAFL